jgi:hypothetical protein
MPTNFCIQIVNPDDIGGPKIEAIIPHSLILNCYKYSPTKYQNFYAAKFVLENPKRIFARIREFNEGGWCFTGRPKTWYIKENVEVPFPDGYVFAVYFNSRFVIYEFRAEYAAGDDSLCPRDWQNRYGALIWTNTS